MYINCVEFFYERLFPLKATSYAYSSSFFRLYDKCKNYINLQYYINNPNKVDDDAAKTIRSAIITLCKQKQSPNFVYDGQTTCQLCQKFIGQVKYIQLSCKHNVHLNCLRQYILSESSVLDISILKGCCKPIAQEELYQAFNQEYVKLIWQKANEELMKELEQQDRQELREREAKAKFECVICGDELFIELDCITLGCNHKFCRSCLSQLIVEKVNQNLISDKDLICPQCNEEIEFSIIKHCVDKNLAEKIDKLRTNLIGVRCPTANCQGQFFVDQGNQFPTCPICNKDFCAKGCGKAHQGKSCEEFKLEEQKRLNFNGRSCTKCGVLIEKTEGCNHITCKCKHEFCYLCGADWKPRKCQCVVNGTRDQIMNFFRNFFRG